MKCPYKYKRDCLYVDTSGMTKTKYCSDCEWGKKGIKETGAVPLFEQLLNTLNKIGLSSKEHDKLRILTTFQHWLGTNYNNLPTDSGNMTKRARKYLKENPNALDL